MFRYVAWYLSVRHSHLASSTSGWWLTLWFSSPKSFLLWFPCLYFLLGYWPINILLNQYEWQILTEYKHIIHSSVCGVCVCVTQFLCGKVRRQLVGVSSLLPSCTSWGSNSGSQDVRLSSKPLHPVLLTSGVLFLCLFYILRNCRFLSLWS